MTQYTLIGDVHGKYSQYKNILKNLDHRSIQVGDMGVGFNTIDRDGERIYSANPPYDTMVAGSHVFIRGNHDNPAICRKHTQWTPDGTTFTTESGTKGMLIGGAWSIDWSWRIPGCSWWEDEECSLEQFNHLVGEYEKFKPDVMITHDGPESAIKEIFINGTHKPLYHSRTGQALDAMFQLHKPKSWFFGHWHTSATRDILGTRFQCLAELETTTIDI
jgi:hypothetical protein